MHASYVRPARSAVSQDFVQLHRTTDQGNHRCVTLKRCAQQHSCWYEIGKRIRYGKPARRQAAAGKEDEERYNVEAKNSGPVEEEKEQEQQQQEKQKGEEEKEEEEVVVVVVEDNHGVFKGGEANAKEPPVATCVDDERPNSSEPAPQHH